MYGTHGGVHCQAVNGAELPSSGQIFELAKVAHQERSSTPESNNEESTNTNKECRFSTLLSNLRLALGVCAVAATLSQPGDLDLDCFFGHTSLPRGICSIRSTCYAGKIQLSIAPRALTGLFSAFTKIDLRLLNNCLEARRRPDLRSGGPSIARSRVKTFDIQASIN